MRIKVNYTIFAWGTFYYMVYFSSFLTRAGHHDVLWKVVAIAHTYRKFLRGWMMCLSRQTSGRPEKIPALKATRLRPLGTLIMLCKTSFGCGSYISGDGFLVWYPQRISYHELIWTTGFGEIRGSGARPQLTKSRIHTRRSTFSLSTLSRVEYPPPTHRSRYQLIDLLVGF